MIRVNLLCQLKSGEHTALKQFLSDNLATVRHFSGCLRVDIYFDEAQNCMLIDEDWHSVEAHQHYIQFITTNQVLAHLLSFFEQPPQVYYFSKSPL
ncbi:antibiotic biosynthesis monooxygenase [Pseudoalteromonas citrea]|uniref:Antibiotic biosynthesis monooxygenase n=1 Tax=Pseudoalteromonas citrea TaxID=43655 RepID=A0A5S3XTF3_9GAMM|nr:antibiotic biosynthesis monooxygenase [Pseudoalteromonas citrea]TMP44744.1 antibiotic biosynthesis monooxygenase [Pseudoalteromonas citrea]TMP61117.1 antibiotic biosynthesis monooxygenase [Pseudoalteromonas citrea]